MNDKLSLKLFLVDRVIEIEDCDYITLDVADDKKGGFSGSYGIKKGHADAIISVREGKVTAQKNGEIVFASQTSSGFATIKKNVVNITVDSIK